MLSSAIKIINTWSYCVENGHSLCGDEILKIISSGNTLRLGSPQEVLHDWIGIISEGNLDWTFEAMNVPGKLSAKYNWTSSRYLPVIACSLICLMLPHQWNELLCSPALGLEIIIIRCTCSSIHHEVDR